METNYRRTKKERQGQLLHLINGVENERERVVVFDVGHLLPSEVVPSMVGLWWRSTSHTEAQ